MPIAFSQVRPWSVLSRLGSGETRFVKTSSSHVCRVGTTVTQNFDPQELVNVVKEAPQPTLLQRLRDWLAGLL